MPLEPSSACLKLDLDAEKPGLPWYGDVPSALLRRARVWPLAFSAAFLILLPLVARFRSDCTAVIGGLGGARVFSLVWYVVLGGVV